MNNNRRIFEQVIESIRCRHKCYYEAQDRFYFLPAHYMALVSASTSTRANTSTSTPASSMVSQVASSTRINFVNHPAFSPLLKSIIETAMQNFSKDPRGFRYSNLIHDFSMYIFMLGGKANYEIICANLPLPKVTTISMQLYRVNSMNQV